MFSGVSGINSGMGRAGRPPRFLDVVHRLGGALSLDGMASILLYVKVIYDTFLEKEKVEKREKCQGDWRLGVLGKTVYNSLLKGLKG